MKGFNEIGYFKRIGLKLILVVSLTVVAIIGVYAYIKIKSESDGSSIK